jgi:hypothetical protein
LFCGNQLTSIPETSILRRKVASFCRETRVFVLRALVPQ